MQFLITQNVMIAPDVWSLRLTGDTRALCRPGQFVQVALPGFYLRRPISVCDWEAGENGALWLVYKRVGHGTDAMSRLKPGDELDLLTGLGNGYDMAADLGEEPLLVGGGVGTPPLYGLCRRLVAAGRRPRVALGFNTKSEIILYDAFEALGVPLAVATADGSAGVRGFVTDAMRTLYNDFRYVYACGPEPMLKAVWERCEERGAGGQFSFESRMACGFGACMGCTRVMKTGAKRVCKDGPVFFREDILW